MVDWCGFPGGVRWSPTGQEEPYRSGIELMKLLELVIQVHNHSIDSMSRRSETWHWVRLNL